MANTVSSYLDQNQTIWNGNKAVSDTVADLNTAIGTTQAKAEQQLVPTGGAEEEKIHVRHDFEDEILRIGHQLSAMASKNGDDNLVAQTELTEAQLDKMSDEVLENTGQRIVDLATANLTGLADYGIVQADVTGLGSLKTEFHGVKTAPRTAVAGRSGQTKTMPAALKNIKTILRTRLDKQMVMFKKSNPEFYAGYLAARVVVDRGGHSSVSPTPPAPQNQPQK